MATQKDIQVCINPHFDAVALWIGSFGGENSPCDISRGVFAGKRGVPRLLDFFKHYGIRTTWGDRARDGAPALRNARQGGT